MHRYETENKLLRELDELAEKIILEKAKWDRHKVFAGNPIEKRKTSNLQKYKTVAQYIVVLEKYLAFLTGHQKRACELAGVSEASFSSWKNKKENYDKFLKWKQETNKETEDKFIREIRAKLGIKT